MYNVTKASHTNNVAINGVAASGITTTVTVALEVKPVVWSSLAQCDRDCR